jgi:hypothetical protein
MPVSLAGDIQAVGCTFAPRQPVEDLVDRCKFCSLAYRENIQMELRRVGREGFGDGGCHPAPLSITVGTVLSRRVSKPFNVVPMTETLAILIDGMEHPVEDRRTQRKRFAASSMEIFGFVKKSPYSSRTRTSFPAKACGYLTTPGIDTDAHVEGWKVIAQAVQAKGSRIFIQLMYAGRMSHPDNTQLHRQGVAPSATAPGAQMFTSTGMQDIPTPRAPYFCQGRASRWPAGEPEVRRSCAHPVRLGARTARIALARFLSRRPFAKRVTIARSEISLRL